ncbi:N-succinylarginine dihydrolase [Sphingomonas morindae]|uniref:N-succinylarginine dihydrolase n=1 Tax=Sphingomonas morindae TaxID=1541170 RepID=A0ABY4X5I6_9SPHN|nr:N-succinylarginine dihydrolase [Sphingomonas morindae]USI72158.1 N-succinylarginine dihydrolase [Sphingomonas morindae]
MSRAEMVEINFDGIVGPTHNYAGLSLGNLAATRHAGAASRPRAAALQGIAKMRANLRLGLRQGILLPHRRPNPDWLAALGTDAAHAGPLCPVASSASAMWAANAATVSPAPDTADGRCHLSVANLVTMAHRSHEWPETLAQLRLAFADERHFAVHGPVPPPFGDEGAANHMRLCPAHDAPGVEVFVYGEAGGPFPARQHREASLAVARRHGVTAPLFVRQSEAAIAAGAFHNDVVAVANGPVLFTHEQAFDDKESFYAALRARVPGVEIIEVPAGAISLADAVASYLFNAQLVTLADGGMALILPEEAQHLPRVWQWLEALVAGNGPIRRLVPVDVRESMANGGGPACLRLRVVCDPSTVDPRFLMDEARLDAIAAVIAAHWPERLDPETLPARGAWPEAIAARAALLEALDLGSLL